MRIAMFTDSYKPQINGVVTSIDFFRKELQKRGHEIFIFTPSSPHYKEKEKGVYRIRSVPFQGYKEYRIGLPFKCLIDFPLKNRNIDVVHVHSPFSMGITGITLAKHYKIPVIGTFHTLFPDYMSYIIKYEKLQHSKIMKKIFTKSTWKYLSWFYNKCDVVIAPSKKIKNILKQKGITAKIVVVPVGIDIPKIRYPKYALREKHGFNRNDKIILHVGRLSKEKNITFIINSLKSLLRNPQYKLIITSDGPYKETLMKKTQRLNLPIHFTGYLSRHELHEYYKLSDVFVMVSKSETQGIVLLEAAFNKLPVVTIHAPVVADFVLENNTGIVSESGMFAANVRKVINNKKLRERLVNNCQKVISNYNIESCTDRIANVYKFQ